MQTLRPLEARDAAQLRRIRATPDRAADNAAAIQGYEKVGFRRVGVMRSYERDAD